MQNKYFGKEAIIGVTALVIIVLMLLMVPGISAEDPSSTSKPSYVGIKSGTDICVMLNGEDSPGEINISSQEAKIEGENGPNGTILLQCENTIDSYESYGAERWTFDNTDLYCLVQKGETGDPFGNKTRDWNIIVSASGNVKLTCHFGDQTEPPPNN